MANGHGGKRINAGRAADADITAARIGLNLFQTDCRQHKETILKRFLEIVEQRTDHKLALEAGKLILDYGFGRPREVITVDGEVVLRQEYESYEELKKVLLERGLPIDRLLEARVLDVEAEEIAENDA